MGLEITYRGATVQYGAGDVSCEGATDCAVSTRVNLLQERDVCKGLYMYAGKDSTNRCKGGARRTGLDGHVVTFADLAAGV